MNHHIKVKLVGQSEAPLMSCRAAFESVLGLAPSKVINFAQLTNLKQRRIDLGEWEKFYYFNNGHYGNAAIIKSYPGCYRRLDGNSIDADNFGVFPNELDVFIIDPSNLIDVHNSQLSALDSIIELVLSEIVSRIGLVKIR